MHAKLEKVRQIMEEQVPSGGRFSMIVRELVENQGKMLRPALLLMSAGFEGQQMEALHLAAALEYLHMASLVHDDIIDQAQERRGRASVVREHGTAMALYTGDYLIYLAAKCLLKIDPARRSTSALDFMSPLLEAEAEQLESRYRIDLPEEEYLLRIEAKTGLLFSLAASAGYALRTSDQAGILEMKQAGLCFGAAFQLRDDLEDLLDPSQGDLREGNYTYPVLLAAAEDAGLSALLGQLKERKGSRQDYETLTRRIRETGAEEQTQKIIGRYVDKAEGIFSRHMGREEHDVFLNLCRELFGVRHDQ